MLSNLSPLQVEEPAGWDILVYQDHIWEETKQSHQDRLTGARHDTFRLTGARHDTFRLTGARPGLVMLPQCLGTSLPIDSNSMQYHNNLALGLAPFGTDYGVQQAYLLCVLCLESVYECFGVV